MGFDPGWKVHDLRYCWFTNAMRCGVPGYIAAAVEGRGEKKNSLRALYLTISDEDLLAAIDMMKFNTGETGVRTKRGFSPLFSKIR